MNNLSRQGLIAFLAAVVTTTSVAERPSECDYSQLFQDKLFPELIDGFCPGIDVMFRITCPNQLCDFPGNFGGNSLRKPQFTGGFQFWIDGKKDETLTCFKSKGYNKNVDVSEDGTKTVTARGHAVFNALEEPDYKIIFSGLNTANVTSPFLYFMKGGEVSYTLSKSNETGTVITTQDYTKITGAFVDVCAELEAALDGGEGEEEVEVALKGDGGGEEYTCANILERKDCKKNGDCRWEGANGCVPMPAPWN